MKQLTW